MAPTAILQIRKITLLEKEGQGLEKIIRITAKTFYTPKGTALSASFVSWDSVPPGSCSSGIVYNNNFTGHIFKIKCREIVTLLFDIEQLFYYKTVWITFCNSVHTVLDFEKIISVLRGSRLHSHRLPAAFSAHPLPQLSLQILPLWFQL